MDMVQFSKALANDWPAQIIKICEEEFEQNKNDCTHFVRAVAKRIGVYLPVTNSSGVVKFAINDPAWTSHKSHKQAIQQAKFGMFVIAGASAETLGASYGHVSVVVATNPEKPGYPNVYSGSIGREAARVKNRGIRWTFSIKDVEAGRVSYFATWPKLI